MIDTASILSCHSQGFARFVKPIDGNADYEALLVDRLGADLARDFSGAQPLEERRRLACAYNRNALQGAAVYAIHPTSPLPACYGSSKNNLREFEWLDRLCAGIGLRVADNNLHSYPRSRVRLTDAQRSEWLPALLDDVTAFYQARTAISPGLVHQQLLYTQTFLSYLVAVSRKGAALPALMVLANDHSPSHVAVSMVMKGAGVPRLYLQHAEITQSFPPLDFEYSVLRNERSSQIYASVGPMVGDVYVISRFENGFRAEVLAKERGKGVPVVIYPTGRLIGDELQKVMRHLQANDAVGKVYIKPHPNSHPPVRTVLGDVQVEILDGTLDCDYVALVANSSVAVELLHQGVPVYQNFDFDPVAPDYYGFVRDGVTTGVSMDELRSMFWKPYRLDERWMAAYARLNPAARPDHDETVAAFLERMAGFVPVDGSSRIAVSRILAMRSAVRPRIRRFARIAATGLVNCFPGLAIDCVRLCVRHTRLASSHRLVNVAATVHSGEAAWEAGQNATPQALDASEPTLASKAKAAVAARRLITAPLVPLIRTNPDAAYFFVRFALGYTRLASQYKLESRALAQPGALQPFAWHVDAAKVELAVLTLDQIREPVAWMAASLRSKVYHDKELILAVDALTRQRSLAVRPIFESLEGLPADSAVRLWCEIKRADWTRAFPSVPELREYARKVYMYDADAYVRQQLEAGLLVLVLRVGEAIDVQQFFAASSRLRPEKLSVKLQLDLLRKLAMFPGHDAEVARLRALFERTASPLHRLKFKNLDTLTGAAGPMWRHAQAEDEFVRAAPAVLAKEFGESVRPVYERLRPRMSYIDVRIDSGQRTALADEIVQALEQGRPFSLVRLGDGEGYLFADHGKFFLHEDVTNRERHWWGTELPPEVRSQIIRAARDAVAHAEVIGIPAVHRFIRDLGDTSPSIVSTIQGRGLLQVLESIEGTASPTARFTEDRVNVAMFQDHDCILDLVRRAQKLVLVCSLQTERLPRELVGAKEFVHIAISTHSRTSDNNAYHRGDGPLPFSYKEHVARLEQHAGPGVLVLVAGGLIGKIFIGAARARGAVALDIGGVVDDWVGSIMPTLR